jgi:hypothetical protein
MLALNLRLDLSLSLRCERRAERVIATVDVKDLAGHAAREA